MNTSKRALLGLAFALVLGCSSKRPAPPAPVDVPSGASDWNGSGVAPCGHGDVRDCSITLGEHNGVLNCYHGSQVCADGVWGTCGSGEMKSLPAPGQLLRGTSGSRLLAVTQTDECVNNPCEPSCLEVSSEPDPGTNQSTIDGDLSEYQWQTGTLSSFPSGLVKKGLNEPCASGDDCQFNTRCQYPVSGSCSHDKCTTGGSLEASCDPCVEDICEVDPTCCGAEPADTVCAHDPCLEGAALSAACDPCVTAICTDYPSCCSGAWDATCTAAVTTLCGNECTCRAGEVAYGDSCYYKEEADESWTDARTKCQERGDGWDLAAINDSAENTFVVDDVIDSSETWIGFTDGNSIGSNGRWRWSSGDPAGEWVEASATPDGDVTVVGYGSAWKYRANNVDPGASWTQVSFSDAAWATGTAELGFGEGDEATAFTKNGPSYYFRHSFVLSKLPTQATLDVLFDDGFVAYVNGTEVLRENVTSTAHTSYASASSSNNEISSSSVSVAPFVIGTNVIAVVVKNRNSSSDDLSFDLNLDVVYGPERVVEFGDSWKYYSAAAAPPASWASAAFDDSAWTSGAGQLGFGESDQATTFAKTGASYYFRRHVTLAETVDDASLSVLYDDGFVAYVNGIEVMRRNVSDTTHTAYATDTAENEVDTDAISTSPFVVGDNVIAVIVKNGSSGSNDVSFDAELEVALSGNSVYENFGSGEPDNEACATYGSNQVGTWADKKCTQKTDSVCEGPPKQMVGGGGVPLSGSWTAIDYGASWKYRANGADPGATWMNSAFSDAAWSTGAAQLGYGDSDETTTFAAANPSYYFRRTVTIPTDISDATLSLVFDDGFVAYVNGTEVARRNVASTSHSSYASSSSGDNETLSVPISTDAFVQGANTIAVVVKNSSSSSSDVSFDLKLQVTLCGAGGCPPDPTWSESCVEKVGSVCDAVCDDHDPPAASGQCVPWFPGETDPSCAGVDLAVGVPCDGVIPVCNHGTAAAPAGLRLVHFPANAGHYPSCSPNTSHPQMTQCFTSAPIPAGECINVTDCAGLSGNREIMINPPGAAQVAECSCRDNWSLYNAGTCGEPSCGGGSSVATLQKKPVDIIFVIDNSGSMQGEIAQVQQRINEDFADIIENSGVDYRVIMMSRYGDLDTAVGGSDYPICVSSPLGGHNCNNPINQGVAHNPPHFYHFSTDVGSLDGLCRLIQGFSNGDELASDNRTWTPVAPTGYRSLLRENARKAFVVITDDRVNCSYGGYSFNDQNTVAGGQAVAAAFDTALLTLSPSQFGTAAERNYVFHSIVAMSENSPGTTPWPASAPIKTGKCTPGSENPGTGYQGLSVLTGGLRYPTCRNDDFDAIFQALAEEVVEGATVSCSVDLTDQGTANPDNTIVRFVPGNSIVPVTFSRVSGAAACVNNAYYYEDGDTITLCPTTCTMVQSDLAGSLAVEVGCAGGQAYLPRTITQVYESECNEDTQVQWGFMTFNTTTPGDSNVRFRMRAAATQAELATAVWIDLITASSTPDTQVCGYGGPSPCPLDLYTLLDGAPLAHHPFVEVELTLNPTSDGAQPSTVQGWQLNYSCPFNQ